MHGVEGLSPFKGLVFGPAPESHRYRDCVRTNAEMSIWRRRDPKNCGHSIRNRERFRIGRGDVANVGLASEEDYTHLIFKYLLPIVGFLQAPA